MSDYNKFPDNAVEITDNYAMQRDFFTYCMDTESRQPTYAKDGSLMEGLFNLRCFWLCSSDNLGYGIMDDWKAKKIRFFRFGTEEEWDKFRYSMESKFRGDNS